MCARKTTSTIAAIPAQDARKSPRITASEALNFTAGRVRDVAALRGLGFSYREIAAHYGVTPQAIALLLIRNRRQMKAIGGSPELANLSVRACAALQRLGVRTRREALAGDVLPRLGNARNCGRKTLEEISDWLAAGHTSVDDGSSEARAEQLGQGLGSVLM